MENVSVTDNKSAKEHAPAITVDAALLLRRLLVILAIALLFVIGRLILMEKLDLTRIVFVVAVLLVVGVSYRKLTKPVLMQGC